MEKEQPISVSVKPRPFDTLPEKHDSFKKIQAFLDPLKKEPDVFIVQIGSNDGISNDDPMSSFIKETNCRGILVEPVPYLFKVLKANYANQNQLAFEQMAINDFDGEADFFYYEPNVRLHENSVFLGTLKKDVMKKHEWWVKALPSDLQVIKVKCLSLESLLIKHQVEKFDVFHMDAEGCDYSILKQLFCTTYRPKVVIFEHRHMRSEEIKELVMQFVKNHYRVSFIDKYDAVAVLRVSRKVISERTIDYKGEFGAELQTCIPYAYYLFQNGLLERTVSSKDTQSLYYFSSNHEERYLSRDFVEDRALPNPTEHVAKLDKSQWVAPPYKEEFKNDRFVWPKKTLMICNKFNSEWGLKPQNFIDRDTLRKLFTILTPHYQVVYNRPVADLIVSDNSDMYELNDKALLEEFTDVISMSDLSRKTPDISFNTLQLMVMANCGQFISVQGGNSVLASYFGGVNLVFMKSGSERYCGDYDHYSDFANTEVIVLDSYEKLLEQVKAKFILNLNLDNPS